MEIKNKYDINFEYFITLSLSNGSINWRYNSVNDIPGTNNGNVTLSINVQLSDGVSENNNESFNFSWVMKNCINSSKSCSRHYYSGSGFTSQNAWETDNGDGTKTYYTFYIDHDSIPSRPNS